MIKIKLLSKRTFQKALVFFVLSHPFVLIFADMKIDITGGINTAHPIAVIPFIFNNHNCTDKKIENTSSIISNDLRNSGKFNTLPIAYLPHQPTKLSEVIPIFWEKLGINTLVLGSIDIHNDNYIVSYQLIDASNNPPLVILENQFLVEEKRLRYAAHAISNEIFEKLMKIQGVFCTKIAYVLHHLNNKKHPYELCIADYDGYNQVSICKSMEPIMSPAWSPDGKKIAYVTFESKRSELIIRNLNTDMISNIINFPNHNGSPAFSPDGKKIAFSLSKTGSLNLYVMDLLSNQISQLTSNRYNNTEPSWFPDNRNLAYTSDQSGIPQVYKIDSKNTDNIQRLSWMYGSNHHPHISFDGTFLIMVNRHQGKQSISKLNLLTGQEEIITKNSFLADTPSIAPNGTMLLYSSVPENLIFNEFGKDTNSNNNYVLDLISIDGKFKARLKSTLDVGNVRFPTWSYSMPCLQN